MLLYRYFASHAFETLKEAKLKASRITSFNDPFEFLFLTKGKITPKHAREYVLSRLNDVDFLDFAARNIPGLLTARNPQKVLKKHLPSLIANIVKRADDVKQTPLTAREEAADRTIRVVCFSDSAIDSLHEILLWSHYSKSHEGVRIGFEIPDGITYPFKISKIIYQEKCFEIDFSLGISNYNVGQGLVDSTKVKSLAWSYEHEYRLLTHPDLCEPRTMPDGRIESFLGFNREWIKSIDFGVRCPESEINPILDLTKAEYPNKILYRKAAFHKSEYALDYVTI
jgi:hypothetical protein